MSIRPDLRSLICRPGVYRIRVAGQLNPKWSEYLEEMTISTVEEQGQTISTEVSGLLPDQAALMGVLEHFYNRNIALLSVEYVGAKPKKDGS